MTGADLKCDCGQGAKDVSPDYEFDEGLVSIQWTCNGGHTLLSGTPGWSDKPMQWRVVDGWHEQARPLERP